VKRSGIILAGAVAVWLGVTMMIRGRIVLDGGSLTALVALFTAIPVVYAAVFLLLAPRRKPRGWSVMLQLGLSLLGLASGFALVSGWAADVPRVAVLVGLSLLLSNVIRLTALLRQVTPKALQS